MLLILYNKFIIKEHVSLYEKKCVAVSYHTTHKSIILYINLFYYYYDCQQIRFLVQLGSSKKFSFLRYRL